MNNSKALFQEFVARLTLNESRDELQSIGYLVFEKILNLSRIDILTDKTYQLEAAQGQSLADATRRLNNYEPVQYVLGEALFFGRMFMVNSSVLIPRPETEELISAVVDMRKQDKTLHILDIGTGSGCIPITLALELKESIVAATDISKGALDVSQSNAKALGANVNFMQHDILLQDLPPSSYDIITSNPPYIACEEKASMNDNVVKHEPHLALFVENDDPLIFYRLIAAKASRALKQNGLLIVEINERFGKEVASLFEQNNFTSIEIIKDLSGKDRIVKGIRKDG